MLYGRSRDEMNYPVLLLGDAAFYIVTILCLLGAAGVALYLMIVAYIEREDLTK